MAGFKGFNVTAKRCLVMPEAFTSEAMQYVSSLQELKACLYFFAALGQEKDFDVPLTLETILAVVREPLEADTLSAALSEACEHGILLSVAANDQQYYLLNTARGRAIQKAAARGLWQPDAVVVPAGQKERPNIFLFYEQNVGPLTPILSEMLEEAERIYPAEWLEEAFTLAVKKNVRNWNYIEAILRSWKEKGRNETDRRNSQENPRNYIEGDLADYIKH
ncbi:MAG: DnaD domain protein [Anaerolineaceae bacterium]|nr:DnaD domain protein [Anaerolineaceae bacterium]